MDIQEIRRKLYCDFMARQTCPTISSLLAAMFRVHPTTFENELHWKKRQRLYGCGALLVKCPPLSHLWLPLKMWCLSHTIVSSKCRIFEIFPCWDWFSLSLCCMILLLCSVATTFTAFVFTFCILHRNIPLLRIMLKQSQKGYSDLQHLKLQRISKQPMPTLACQEQG